MQILRRHKNESKLDESVDELTGAWTKNIQSPASHALWNTWAISKLLRGGETSSRSPWTNSHKDKTPGTKYNNIHTTLSYITSRSKQTSCRDWVSYEKRVYANYRLRSPPWVKNCTTGKQQQTVAVTHGKLVTLRLIWVKRSKTSNSTSLLLLVLRSSANAWINKKSNAFQALKEKIISMLGANEPSIFAKFFDQIMRTEVKVEVLVPFWQVSPEVFSF